MDLSKFARRGPRRMSRSGSMSNPSALSSTSATGAETSKRASQTPNQHTNNATSLNANMSASCGARAINRIAAKDAEVLNAGQTMYDVRSIVKELLENALDAGGAMIDIVMSGPAGTDSIVVLDDGCGINECDFQRLCLLGTSSKRMRDSTFGYRGAALASICATCKEVRVITRTQDNDAVSLDFNQRGSFLSQKRAKRNVGTTVEVKGIFEPLPVRRKHAISSASRTIAQTVATVQAYALVTRARIKLTVDGRVRLFHRPNILHTGVPVDSGNLDLGELRYAATKVLNRKLISTLIDFSAVIGEGLDFTVSVTGLVSSPGAKSPGSAPRYLFINRRPVEMQRLVRSMNDAFRRASGTRVLTPAFILNLSMDPSHADVNLSTDKRVVTIDNEKEIVDVLTDELFKVWAPTDVHHLVTQDLRSILKPSQVTENAQRNLDISQGTSHSFKPAKVESGTKPDLSVLLSANREIVRDKFSVHEDEIVKNIEPPRQVRTYSDPYVQSRKRNELRESDDEERGTSKKKARVFTGLFKTSRGSSSTRNPKDSVFKSCGDPKTQTINSPENQEAAKFANPGVATVPKNRGLILVPPHPAITIQPSTTQQPLGVSGVRPSRQETSKLRKGHYARSAWYREHKCPVDWDVLFLDEANAIPAKMPRTPIVGFFREATLSGGDGPARETEEQQSAASSELTRLFRQDWFKDLHVLGQFNLGFIIVKLGRELFVVDQHAADEKRKFELYVNKKPKIQVLVAPLHLPMSAADELVVIEHFTAFMKAGYKIKLAMNEAPCKRLWLLTQPSSVRGGASSFVLDDIADLVESAKQCPPRPGVPFRPPRARAACASMACRRSVMVGDALSRPSMRHIVRNLADLKHPWNCPHGRPTIRHLASLGHISTE